MKKRSLLFLVFGLAILHSVAGGPRSAASGGDGTTLIKAGKIYTVSKGVIENGTILVERGKISAVGKNVSAPPGAPVIAARVVIPGLVDIHSHLGVYSLPSVQENSDGNESTNPVTPQVHALDSFNFEDPSIKVGLAAGVTTIVSRPGSANVIGGTSVAVKLKNIGGPTLKWMSFRSRISSRTRWVQ